MHGYAFMSTFHVTLQAARSRPSVRASSDNVPRTLTARRAHLSTTSNHGAYLGCGLQSHAPSVSDSSLALVLCRNAGCTCRSMHGYHKCLLETGLAGSSRAFRMQEVKINNTTKDGKCGRVVKPAWPGVAGEGWAGEARTW